ncbi:2415_t:CDS:2 [Ambispora gerdemannii]|uniref:2415_t:CDS:1 n=1 Tax=Ambispora gerdemannii TaxID=144530 RepID=A0A9N9AFR6_9GLOM|nr:2415_t:CDS:2 [Ambispora gerdemannii]
MLKEKLELLNKEFALLKTKITTKLASKDQALQQTNSLLAEAHQKAETLTKENQENEKPNMLHQQVLTAWNDLKTKFFRHSLAPEDKAN